MDPKDSAGRAPAQDAHNGAQRPTSSSGREERRKRRYYDHRSRGKGREGDSNRERPMGGDRPSNGGVDRGHQVDSTAKFNDPAWYLANPVLAKDAASLYFNNVAGLRLNVPALTCPSRTNTGFSKAITGLLTVTLSPAIGVSKESTSVINIASQSIYSWVRHANSGHANYEAPDLMMYLLACGSIYSFYGWCMKLLACITSYQALNRYLPRAIAIAQHADLDDLTRNAVNFRFWLNALAAKMSSFAVPAQLPYFQHCLCQYMYVLQEGSTIKDQLYTFAPRRFWKWRSDSSGSHLENINGIGSTTHLLAVKEIMAIGDEMVNALMGDEDVGIMSGDIKKAYPALFLLPYIPDSLVLNISTDHNIMLQIHNLRTVPDFSVAPEQTKGVIKFNPTVTFGPADAIPASGSVLDIDEEVPDVPSIVEATRLTPSFECVDGTHLGMLDCGTFVATSVHFARLSAGGLELEGFTTSDVISANANVTQIDAYTKFHYSPIIYLWSYQGTEWQLNGFLGEFSNYTNISDNNLHNLHEAALLSEFGVPGTTSVA